VADVFTQYRIYIDWNVVFNATHTRWRFITVNKQLCIIHMDHAQSAVAAASTAATSSSGTPSATEHDDHDDADGENVENAPSNHNSTSSSETGVFTAAGASSSPLKQQQRRYRFASDEAMSMATAFANAVQTAKKSTVLM
jgi:hypothetical protein